MTYFDYHFFHLSMCLFRIINTYLSEKVTALLLMKNKSRQTLPECFHLYFHLNSNLGVTRAFSMLALVVIRRLTTPMMAPLIVHYSIKEKDHLSDLQSLFYFQILLDHYCNSGLWQEAAHIMFF